jgi:hypothetical protein
MENTNWLDLFVGLLALFIVVSGLVMLFQGICAFDKK